MYAEKIRVHEQREQEQVQEMQRIQQGFIPSGGTLAKADLYVNRPGTTKAERATFPIEALQWLKEQLEKQGTSQEQLALLEQQNLVDMAANNPQQQPAGPLDGQPQPPPQLPIPQGGI